MKCATPQWKCHHPPPTDVPPIPIESAIPTDVPPPSHQKCYPHWCATPFTDVSHPQLMCHPLPTDVPAPVVHGGWHGSSKVLAFVAKSLVCSLHCLLTLWMIQVSLDSWQLYRLQIGPLHQIFFQCAGFSRGYPDSLLLLDTIKEIRKVMAWQPLC